MGTWDFGEINLVPVVGVCSLEPGLDLGLRQNNLVPVVGVSASQPGLDLGLRRNNLVPVVGWVLSLDWTSTTRYQLSLGGERDLGLP